MNAAQPVCKAQGLHRRFGPVEAVRNLSLEIQPGEVVALLGPNGAGKTTTLSMLTDNLAPHAGQVWIAGHDLAASPLDAKQALGYLPEQPPLYTDMRVDDYLSCCAALHGIKRGARTRAVDEACERTALDEVKTRLIGHLSKGYRQRVGLAQAIVHRPAFVVLDEPTSGLDPLQNRETRQLVRNLAEHAGVLFSTHQLAEVAPVADRVAIIHRGELAYETRLNEYNTASRQFHLELAHPPTLEHLARLPGIATAEALGSNGFLITAETATAIDPREALARAALAEEWGLLALSPEKPSLEALFMRIVHTEDKSSAEAEQAA